MNFTSDTMDNSTNESQGDPEALITYSIPLMFQVGIAGVGWIENVILLYAQSKTDSWPFYQRLQFFNITAAAMMTAMIHCIQGSVQLCRFFVEGSEELVGEWSDVPGDSAHVAVAFGTMVLAFQNLYALRQISKNPRANSDKRSKPIGAVLVCAVWILAFGAILVGLNPHPEAGVDTSQVLTLVSYAVHLSTQISICIAIWFTRRVINRVETDFAARGAQQSLQTRTHVKQTIDLTAAITRVVTLHIFTWLASFTAAFAINQLTTDAGKDEQEVDDGNLMAAYTGIVDCLALLFEAGYPIILIWKQPQIQRALKNCVRCLSKSSSQVTPGEESGYGRNGARSHHQAINQHWEMVRRVKFDDNQHGTNHLGLIDM